MEDRFGIVINLKTYDHDSLCEIIKSSIKKIDLELSNDEISEIAKNAKGIPRNANRLIRRIKDFRLDDESISIKKILKRLQIVVDGLDVDDIAYLNAIKMNNHATGLKTISQLTNIDQQTIEIKIEPFLIQKQLISKTLNGRLLTEKGINFVDKYAKAP
jgi:Holliday junction DNA helicase RuvB